MKHQTTFDFDNVTIIRSIGEGNFGTTSLTSNGVVIKEGEIGVNEEQALNELSHLNVTPRLLGTQRNTTVREYEGVQSFSGKLAMEMVEGSLMSTCDYNEELLQSHRSVMAKINLAGWAHNDAHFENAIHSNGELKIIDFGLASKDSNDVIAEAFDGGYFGMSCEDWDKYKVSNQFKADHLKRAMKAVDLMLADGITGDCLFGVLQQSLDFLGASIFGKGEALSLTQGINDFNEVSPEKVESYLNVLYEDVI